MIESIPQSVLEYGPDFDWDEENIWNLNVDVTVISIDELSWHFDIPFWDYEDRDYVLTPNDVLENPLKYSNHYKRIISSDIAYPIDVIKNKGRLVILDGLHRLVHLRLEGYDKIKVRIIPDEMIPLFAKEEN